MDLQNIPESPDFRALEARLDAGDLSLDQIREIEDEVFFRVTDKTLEIAGRVFAKIDKTRALLLGRNIAVLDGRGRLEEKIRELGLFQGEMESEEVEGRLRELEAEVLLEGGAVQEAAKRQLEHLAFAQEHPLVLDLEEGPLNSNFLTRMRLVGKRIVEEGSLASLGLLNEVQRREVAVFMGRGK